ncbi:MAG: ABC transporter substrate-binding protein [Actinomycetota bacterium]|nr:ABC transporter substrate-binding protein [Actinomycetota bacterium]
MLGGTVAGAVLFGLAGCAGEQGADTADGRQAPSRVIALGQGADADALIALGIVPVAMSAGYQAPIYPWTAQALNGRPVEVIETNTTVPVEQVAALKPDLIVATTYYQLNPVRERLEQIAPVVGPGGGVDKETWQTTTIRVGEAVGRAD